MKKIFLSAALVAMLFGSVYAVNKNQIVGSADQASSVSKSVAFTENTEEEEQPVDDSTSTTTSTSTTSTSTTSTTKKTTKTTSSSSNIIVE